MKGKVSFTQLWINLSLKDKKIVISGGGDSAIDWTNDLASASAECHISS